MKKQVDNILNHLVLSEEVEGVLFIVVIHRL
jgi:hypothetical protein